MQRLLDTGRSPAGVLSRELSLRTAHGAVAPREAGSRLGPEECARTYLPFRGIAGPMEWPGDGRTASAPRNGVPSMLVARKSFGCLAAGGAVAFLLAAGAGAVRAQQLTVEQ